jgi:ribosome-binding protein aMBF1 (putative translation factor)
MSGFSHGAATRVVGVHQMHLTTGEVVATKEAVMSQPSPQSSRSFAARLRELREEAGVSARRLSDLAGLAPSHVALIESEVRPNVEMATVTKLATVLGASLDWLVRGEGERPERAAVAAAVATAAAAPPAA